MTPVPVSQITAGFIVSQSFESALKRLRALCKLDKSLVSADS